MAFQNQPSFEAFVRSVETSASRTLTYERYIAKIFFPRPSLGEKGVYHIRVFKSYEAAREWVLTYEKLKKFLVGELICFRKYAEHPNHVVSRTTYEIQRFGDKWTFVEMSHMVGLSNNLTHYVDSEWVLDPVFRDLETD